MKTIFNRNNLMEMKLKQLLFGFLFLMTTVLFAQKNTKEVLFTVNEKPYYTEEFSRVYKKNLDLVKDESQKDLDQYLELFIGYKLKVNKAYKLGLSECLKVGFIPFKGFFIINKVHFKSF